MYNLTHLPLAPHGRFVRLVLAEKGAPAELVALDAWDGPDDLHGALGDGDGGPEPILAGFAALSPDRDGPELTVPGDAATPERRLRGAVAIAEFLEEAYPGRPLLPADPGARAEVRRLVEWFCGRFYEDAARPLIEEKLVTKLTRRGELNSARLRAGAAAAHRHLCLMSKLIEPRRWLAGDEISLADFAAAAQISVLDYLDHAAWAEHRPVKEWYAVMKCRPSFRGLLADRAPGMPPSRSYADFNF